MKLTFILFAFFINFSYPLFIKAEKLIDVSNNQIENILKKDSLIKEAKIKKIHIDQEGETISRISKFYSIDKELIIKLNDLKDENYIYVGQNLKLFNVNQNELNHISGTHENKNKFHIVKKGENLTEISNQYGLNFRYLIEINNLKNPDSLKVGSKLILQKKTTISNQSSQINKYEKTYGPITIQQNQLEEIRGRKVLNVINKSNKKLIISINCQSNDIDVRIPGRKWRGWSPATEEFEKDLINDFC